MLSVPAGLESLGKNLNIYHVEGLRPRATDAMRVRLALRLVKSNLSGNDGGWRAPIATHQLGMRFVPAQRNAYVVVAVSMK